MWYLSFFRKRVKKSWSFLKIRQKERVRYIETYAHLWQHLGEFFLKREIFQIKVVDKIKRNIIYSVTYFRKSHCLCDYVEKCGTAGQPQKTIRCMCLACWITMATHTNSEYLLLFRGNNGYENATQYYVIDCPSSYVNFRIAYREISWQDNKVSWYLNTTVCWNVTPCLLVGMYQLFRETGYLLQNVNKI